MDTRSELPTLPTVLAAGVAVLGSILLLGLLVYGMVPTGEVRFELAPSAGHREWLPKTTLADWLHFSAGAIVLLLLAVYGLAIFWAWIRPIKGGPSRREVDKHMAAILGFLIGAVVTILGQPDRSHLERPYPSEVGPPPPFGLRDDLEQR